MPHDTSSIADTSEFPTAKLEPRRAVLASSRMWWATAVALAVACLLVWRSVDVRGPKITIRFPEGHGLQVGDYVRHRGIEVGQVDRLDLTDDLAGIEVDVTLLDGAAGLAREGSRFWIVRPQFSLTEIRGLDTAIGAKYIAVRPAASSGSPQFEFDGLAVPPPDDMDDAGVDLVLRGDNSYGLSVGAPVSWRGVDVGKVLGVDLASDTRFVDVRVRIEAAYRNLIRSNSKFWATSGLGIDAGFTGFTLKAESLTTIARGGVSFITPAEDDDGESPLRVQPGHVFTLHAEEDADWTEAASTVSLIDFPLPPTIVLRATWKQKQFGFTRTRQRDVNGLLIAEEGSSTRLVAPADAARPPEAALEDTWQFSVFVAGTEGPLVELGAEVDFQPVSNGLAECEIRTQIPNGHSIAGGNVRRPAEPEDCCLARSVSGDHGPSSVIHSLSRASLSAREGRWLIDSESAHLDDWLGAAVVATADGAVIGMFLVTDAGPAIVPLPQANAHP